MSKNTAEQYVFAFIEYTFISNSSLNMALNNCVRYRISDGGCSFKTRPLTKSYFFFASRCFKIAVYFVCGKTSYFRNLMLHCS